MNGIETAKLLKLIEDATCALVDIAGQLKEINSALSEIEKRMPEKRWEE